MLITTVSWFSPHLTQKACHGKEFIFINRYFSEMEIRLKNFQAAVY
jgi:hypothetical protein